MNTNRKIDIMGIVNLTDDSYYSGSRCPSAASAVDLAGKHISGGASIIDVGACSTRPGSFPVGAEEEWRRLQPVLTALRSEYPNVMISVDTYWAEVVEKVYDLIGEIIVNDISAGEDDPLMLSTVGKLGLTYVAMHKRGDPMTMQSMTDYLDVTDEVARYFMEFSYRAETYGIKNWIMDPGFGFAKTLDQNYELLRNMAGLKEMLNGRRILVGISRKSMIYKALGITPEESLPATQVVHLAALLNGADILRVHDSAEAARTIELYRRLI